MRHKHPRFSSTNIWISFDDTIRSIHGGEETQSKQVLLIPPLCFPSNLQKARLITNQVCQTQQTSQYFAFTFLFKVLKAFHIWETLHKQELKECHLWTIVLQFARFDSHVRSSDDENTAHGSPDIHNRQISNSHTFVVIKGNRHLILVRLISHFNRRRAEILLS